MRDRPWDIIFELKVTVFDHHVRSEGIAGEKEAGVEMDRCTCACMQAKQHSESHASEGWENHVGGPNRSAQKFNREVTNDAGVEMGMGAQERTMTQEVVIAIQCHNSTPQVWRVGWKVRTEQHGEKVM